jgi:hypothetical protein
MIDLSKALLLLMSKYHSITRIAKVGNEIGSHNDKTLAKEDDLYQKAEGLAARLMTVPISLIKTMRSD